MAGAMGRVRLPPCDGGGPRTCWDPRFPAFSSLCGQAGGRRGVTAAICVVDPAASSASSLDRPALGAAAALAAFTAIYGHALPYRRRAVVVAGVGAALTLAGGLGAPHRPTPRRGLTRLRSTRRGRDRSG